MEWIGLIGAAVAPVIVALITFGSGGAVAKELKILSEARSMLPADAAQPQEAIDKAIVEIAKSLEDARFQRASRLPRLAMSISIIGLVAIVPISFMAWNWGQLKSDWFFSAVIVCSVTTWTGCVLGAAWLADKKLNETRQATRP